VGRGEEPALDERQVQGAGLLMYRRTSIREEIPARRLRPTGAARPPRSRVAVALERRAAGQRLLRAAAEPARQLTGMASVHAGQRHDFGYGDLARHPKAASMPR
jgi:hypothetical protein